MRDIYQRRNSAPAIRSPLIRRPINSDDVEDESQASSRTDLSPNSRSPLQTIFSKFGESNSDVSATPSECPSPIPTPDVFDELKSTDAEVSLGKTLSRQTSLRGPKHQHQRLVGKDGACNVAATRITKRYKRFVADMFTTIFDMQWRYLVIVFIVVFIGSWFVFALFWYAQAMVHGDYMALVDPEWPSCVTNVYDYPTALLFSIETQHTIGYGSRAVEITCGFSFVLLMLQACYGILAQTVVTGLVFAKLLRPKRRAKTMLFSRKAVINLRDDGYCFLFRVADIRRSHIIATSLRAMLVRSRLTKEGETIPLCQFAMSLETEADFGDNFVFLAWPATIVHRITNTSPLWDMSYKHMLNERFEIIVILEGTVENTGMMTQFRTSYLPDEIEWGSRLKPLVTYSTTSGPYDIDFSQFDATEKCTWMPDCSAKKHAKQQAQAAAAAAAAAKQRDTLDRFPASLVVGPAIKRPPSITRLLINRCKKLPSVRSTQSISELQNRLSNRVVDVPSPKPEPQTLPEECRSSRSFDPQPMIIRVKTHTGLQQLMDMNQEVKYANGTEIAEDTSELADTASAFVTPASV